MIDTASGRDTSTHTLTLLRCLRTLAVLTFLRQLKVVFDESGITEAMGSILLFDFVRGKASRMLESARASVDRSIISYPGLF
jgi:hypothetical protein